MRKVGWMKKRQVRASLMMGLVIAASSVYAREPLPDGFLEFLGEMVEADGELVGPLTLETPMDAAIAESTDGAPPAHEPETRRNVEDEP